MKYKLLLLTLLVWNGTKSQTLNRINHEIPELKAQSSGDQVDNIHRDVEYDNVRKILSFLLEEKQDCQWIVLTDPTKQSRIFE